MDLGLVAAKGIGNGPRLGLVWAKNIGPINQAWFIGGLGPIKRLEIHVINRYN